MKKYCGDGTAVTHDCCSTETMLWSGMLFSVCSTDTGRGGKNSVGSTQSPLEKQQRTELGVGTVIALSLSELST